MKWQIATIILVISAILICGCTQQPTTVTPAPVTGTKAPATTAATIATVPKSTTSQPSVPIAQPSVPIAQEALSPFDQMTFDASGYYEEALQLAFESWNSSGNMDWVTSRTFLNQANDKLNLAKKTFEQASPVASTPEQKEYLSLKSQAIMNMAKSLETDGKVLEDGFDLEGDHRFRDHRDSEDLPGVLGGDGGDDRGPPDPEGSKGLQVGLDPRTSPGIGPGTDHSYNGCRRDQPPAPCCRHS